MNYRETNSGVKNANKKKSTMSLNNNRALAYRALYK